MAPTSSTSTSSTPARVSSPQSSVDAQKMVLRVGGLPVALSDDAVTTLLSHYGATSVRVLRRKKPGVVLRGTVDQVVSTAIAEFSSPKQLQDAQQRLAKVHLAGRKLTVEIPDKGDEHQHNEALEMKSRKGETHVSRDQPTVPTSGNTGPETPPVPNLQNTPAPLASHLGLNYAPSPLLQYKYPKATIPIVRNIANALIALPRFYTQVLHLMNKMNLPIPFEPDAIPGRFSPEFMPELRDLDQSQDMHPQHTDQIVEEDDDEEEELLEAPSLVKRRSIDDEIVSSPGRKRPRIAIGASASPPRSSGSILPRPGVITTRELDRQRLPDDFRVRDPAFFCYSRGEPSCRVQVGNVPETVEAADLNYVFGYVLPPAFPLESLEIEVTRSSRSALITFPNLESAERAVAQINGVVVDGQPLVVCYDASEVPPQAPALNRTEDWKRMDPNLLSKEKAMKNYQRGDPTAALYIKNLAKAVDEGVLQSLCQPWLSSSISTNSLSIRHFAEGRMKNQAFIEFPSAEIAANILDKLHGLVVHGKPLVVSFRKTPASQSHISTNQNG